MSGFKNRTEACDQPFKTPKKQQPADPSIHPPIPLDLEYDEHANDQNAMDEDLFRPQPIIPVDPLQQACDMTKQLFAEMEAQVEGFDEFSASLDEMDRAHEYYTSLIDAMDPELVDEKLDAMDVVAFDLGTAHTRAQQAGRSLQLLSPSFTDMMIQLHRRVHSRPS